MLIANVIAMRSTQVGDYIYRVSQPSLAMGRVPGIKVVTVGVLSPHLGDVLRTADVAILHLLSEADVLPLMEARRQRGQVTVYEISDHFMAAHQGVGIRGWFSDPVNRANALALIHGADAVQVTGRGLADAFGEHNRQTVVFENQIESMGQPPREPGGTVRIGWAGSDGHTQDLIQIRGVIADACRRFPNATFSFMGNDQQFEQVFGAIPSAQKTYTRPGSLADYRRFLDTLDIGIAPMLSNPYNHCRSDVKFLEYAASGVVPVLQRITPYEQHAIHGKNAFLFRDATELGAILTEVISNAALRGAVSREAHAYVSTDRREDHHAAERVRFYASLATGAPADNLGDVPLHRLDPGSQTYDVETHPAETALVLGIEAEATGAPSAARARAFFDQAAALRPDYALAYFWRGRSHELRHEPEAANGFARAIEANPSSLRAFLHLARVQAPREPDVALATLDRGLAVSPRHAPFLEAQAQVHEDRGDLERARRLYQAARDASAFLGSATAGLGRVCSRLGRTAEALEAFRAAVASSPDDAVAHRMLAEQLFASGDVARASAHCVRALELDRHDATANALLPKLISALEKVP